MAAIFPGGDGLNGSSTYHTNGMGSGQRFQMRKRHNYPIKLQKRRIGTFACNNLHVFAITDGDFTDVITRRYNDILIDNWLQFW